MSRVIHVHLHGTRDAFSEADHPRADNGRFSSGGEGHRSDGRHANNERAQADIKARREGLEGSGYKHEKTEGKHDDVRGELHHLVHADGSRAVITNKSDGITGRHTVSSYENKALAKKKAKDAEFKESDHPRKDNGQFGQGATSKDPKERAKALQEALKTGNRTDTPAGDRTKPHVEQSERSKGAAILAKAIVAHKDDPKSGKSDFAKAREAELDDKRDAEYAAKRKAATETGEKLDKEVKAKVATMTPDQRKKRLEILKTKLNALSDGAPLRDKVAITREMKAIESAQGEKLPDTPTPAPKAKPGPRKVGGDSPKRKAYEAAVKLGNMVEARKLLAELKKTDRELDKGGSR